MMMTWRNQQQQCGGGVSVVVLKQQEKVIEEKKAEAQRQTSTNRNSPFLSLSMEPPDAVNLMIDRCLVPNPSAMLDSNNHELRTIMVMMMTATLPSLVGVRRNNNNELESN
jgi:hypothetical protein